LAFSLQIQAESRVDNFVRMRYHQFTRDWLFSHSHTHFNEENTFNYISNRFAIKNEVWHATV